MSKLKLLLKKKNIKITELAKMLNIPHSHIYKWINKYNPSKEYAEKIAVILDCKIIDLYHNTFGTLQKRYKTRWHK